MIRQRLQELRLRVSPPYLVGGLLLLSLLAALSMSGAPFRGWAYGLCAFSGGASWVYFRRRLQLRRVAPASQLMPLSPEAFQQGSFLILGARYWSVGCLAAAAASGGLYALACVLRGGGGWAWLFAFASIAVAALAAWQLPRGPRLELKDWQLSFSGGSYGSLGFDLRKITDAEPSTIIRDPSGVVSVTHDAQPELLVDPYKTSHPHQLQVMLTQPVAALKAYFSEAGGDGPDIPVGSHLKVWRAGYTHHGIYAGRGWMIHYTGEVFKTILGLSKPEIRFDRVRDFSSGKKVIIVDHPEGAAGPERTIARAFSKLHEQDYDLFENNCEHFASWCRTGQMKSPQAERMAQLLPEALQTPLRFFGGLGAKHPRSRWRGSVD